MTDFKWVTGKLALNEDRTAEIYPLIEGRVHEMRVRFGQDVREGELLAVIDSRDVGEAKLELLQDRLATNIAKVNYQWNSKINENVQELIVALERGTALTELDAMFQGKPMGEYRQQLLTAYANLHKSRSDYQRLSPLAEQGTVAGKQAIYAKASLEADQATFNAWLEQLKFTAQQRALQSEQTLEKAQTQEHVSRSRLFILGYHEDDLEGINPLTEGEEITHYPVKAPFDGTIIGKDVVIADRVGPEQRMFQLADLSTLWVQADIYQEDLERLAHVGKTIRFRSPAYDHDHEAQVFYAGDVVDPETRTARLMASVDNSDRHLKPGMFAEVQLPGEATGEVLQIPLTAVQEHEGETFVFVHEKGEEFQRRDVKLGRTGNRLAEVSEGIEAGESVVVEGAFALKSKLLSGSVGGTHAH